MSLVEGFRALYNSVVVQRYVGTTIEGNCQIERVVVGIIEGAFGELVANLFIFR